MHCQMSTREAWYVKILINVYKVLWNSKVQFKHHLLFLIVNIKTEQEQQNFNLDPTYPFREMA